MKEKSLAFYVKLYYNIGTDLTGGKDWMDVTDQMQHDLVREFGYSDEAVQLLRRAPQLYPGNKVFLSSCLIFELFTSY